MVLFKYSVKDVAHTKGYGEEGQRVITLIPKAVSILEEMRQINGDRHYIFQTSGQLPPSENKVNERLRKICDNIGIRYFSSHKFRFRFVSDCYEAQAPERAIQTTVGHSDIKTTQGYDRSDEPVISREQMASIIDY